MDRDDYQQSPGQSVKSKNSFRHKRVIRQNQPVEKTEKENVTYVSSFENLDKPAVTATAPTGSSLKLTALSADSLAVAENAWSSVPSHSPGLNRKASKTQFKFQAEELRSYQRQNDYWNSNYIKRHEDELKEKLLKERKRYEDEIREKLLRKRAGSTSAGGGRKKSIVQVARESIFGIAPKEKDAPLVSATNSLMDQIHDRFYGSNQRKLEKKIKQQMQKCFATPCASLTTNNCYCTDVRIRDRCTSADLYNQENNPRLCKNKGIRTKNRHKHKKHEYKHEPDLKVPSHENILRHISKHRINEDVHVHKVEDNACKQLCYGTPGPGNDNILLNIKMHYVDSHKSKSKTTIEESESESSEEVDAAVMYQPDTVEQEIQCTPIGMTETTQTHTLALADEDCQVIPPKGINMTTQTKELDTKDACVCCECAGLVQIKEEIETSTHSIHKVQSTSGIVNDCLRNKCCKCPQDLPVKLTRNTSMHRSETTIQEQEIHLYVPRHPPGQSLDTQMFKEEKHKHKSKKKKTKRGCQDLRCSNLTQQTFTTSINEESTKRTVNQSNYGSYKTGTNCHIVNYVYAEDTPVKLKNNRLNEKLLNNDIDELVIKNCGNMENVPNKILNKHVNDRFLNVSKTIDDLLVDNFVKGGSMENVSNELLNNNDRFLNKSQTMNDLLVDDVKDEHMVNVPNKLLKKNLNDRFLNKCKSIDDVLVENVVKDGDMEHKNIMEAVAKTIKKSKMDFSKFVSEATPKRTCLESFIMKNPSSNGTDDYANVKKDFHKLFTPNKNNNDDSEPNSLNYNSVIYQSYLGAIRDTECTVLNQKSPNNDVEAAKEDLKALIDRKAQLHNKFLRKFNLKLEMKKRNSKIGDVNEFNKDNNPIKDEESLGILSSVEDSISKELLGRNKGKMSENPFKENFNLDNFTTIMNNNLFTDDSFYSPPDSPIMKKQEEKSVKSLGMSEELLKTSMLSLSIRSPRNTKSTLPYQPAVTSTGLFTAFIDDKSKDFDENIAKKINENSSKNNQKKLNKNVNENEGNNNNQKNIVTDNIKSNKEDKQKISKELDVNKSKKMSQRLVESSVESLSFKLSPTNPFLHNLKNCEIINENTQVEFDLGIFSDVNSQTSPTLLNLLNAGVNVHADSCSVECSTSFLKNQPKTTKNLLSKFCFGSNRNETAVLKSAKILKTSKSSKILKAKDKFVKGQLK